VHRFYAPVDDLDPLVDVIGPLTPALGVRISTVARPNAQGTMALYLAAGGDSQDLLGLSCRHVLIGSTEANLDYASHPHAPRKDVLHLGIRAYSNVVDSIKLTIARHGIAAKRYRKQIEGFEEREKGTGAADVETARAKRVETEEMLAKADKAMLELSKLLDRVKKDWKYQDNHVIGSIVRSPPIQLGVGQQRFTEDWGLFKIDRSKLGNGFKVRQDEDFGYDLRDALVVAPRAYQANGFPDAHLNVLYVTRHLPAQHLGLFASAASSPFPTLLLFLRLPLSPRSVIYWLVVSADETGALTGTSLFRFVSFFRLTLSYLLLTTLTSRPRTSGFVVCRFGSSRFSSLLSSRKLTALTFRYRTT
jgi:hypothetical protein